VQEAKAASALNHPNIITIHDIDSETVNGEPLDFIAMEYVSGRTLDRLIGRKGLHVEDALRYAVQIADALASAHAGGIIHRDLKPANVMVTDQGLVKVLDFGLAKLTEPAEADAFAPTESVRLDESPRTESGTIVGTVAYMSPEQAEGKKMDARSDVFSLGTLLYEMITGRRAFSGDSKLSILATILHKEPAPVRQSVAVPRELERILVRCLRKDPQRRWQVMADLKLALEELLDDVESGAGIEPAAPRATTGQVLRQWLGPIAIALLISILGVYFVRRPAPPPSFQRLTFRRGDVTSARFAPGGQTIVYAAEWDGAPSTIFSTVPGNPESRSLGLPDGRLLSIDRTGEMAVLLGAGPQGTLARVPLAGGAPREVLEHVSDADWGPDGSSLALVRTVNGRNRLEFPAGKVLYETEGRAPISPRVSPRGDLVAFFDFDTEIGDFSLSVVGPDTPKRRLARGWRGVGRLAWAPGGDIWFSALYPGSDPALRAVDLAGKQRIIAQTPNWMVLHDIGRDGRLLVSSVNSRISISGLPPGAAAERDLSWLDTSWVYELSADGKTLLFLELSYGEGRNTAIYLRRTDGSPAVRLGDGNRPALSPDGKWVVCVRSDAARSQLVLLPTGAGEARLLTTAGMRYEAAEWFPDGRRILFTGNQPGRPPRTWVQELAAGQPRPITPEGIRAARVSPDNRFVVVTRAGKHFLHDLAGGGEQRPIPGIEPTERPLRWSADGQALLLRRQQPGEPRVTLHRLNVFSGRKELLRELKPPDPVGVVMGQVAVTPDGKSYAYSYQRDLASLYLVQGLR
jgi:Tol biopolymer transport system component